MEYNALAPSENCKCDCVSYDNISANTSCTYPKYSIGYKIWCDAFAIKKVGERVFFSIADGCNWGNRPRRAAQAAAKV